MERTVSGPQLNVIGKIDLSAINQQTRPKKKEQGRAPQRAYSQGSCSPERSGWCRCTAVGRPQKRRRIGKEKVDIEKTSNQQPSQRGGDSEKGQGEVLATNATVSVTEIATATVNANAKERPNPRSATSDPSTPKPMRRMFRSR